MNPLNGDIILQSIVKNIVKTNNIDVIIETGTHMGWSTGFFSDLVQKVITTEINEEWQNKAKFSLRDKINIEFVLGDSATTLKGILSKLENKRVLYFLDSHFNNDLSLNRELKIIEESNTEPYIMIHDFKVPNRIDLGYDSWDGMEYSIESFAPLIESLYKKRGYKGYKCYYNSESVSGQRGCIILEPINIDDMPESFRSEFTLNGEIKSEKYYFEPYADNTEKTYTKDQINCYKTLISDKKGAYYPDTDVLLYEALNKYDIKGKDVVVVGSEQPWYETIALMYSNRPCVCLEYNKRLCESTEIIYYQYDSYEKLKAKKFDVCISVSSIEHSGLGRYGDKIDPNGDIKALKDIKNLLKKDGLLFLSVPVGEDRVMWNAHRVYGRKRFELLFEGWECLDTYGLTNELLETSANSYATVQPIIVLKNNDSALENAVWRRLINKNKDISISKEATDVPMYEARTLYQIPIDLVRVDPKRPRKSFDSQGLEEMAASVAKHGIIQPIILRRGLDGTAIVVAGERRIAAAKKVGFTEIPGIFVDGNPTEISLVENMQRQDLTAVEEAEALLLLVEEQKFTDEQLSGILGKDRTTISDIMLISSLPINTRNEYRGTRKISKVDLIEIARKEQVSGVQKDCKWAQYHFVAPIVAGTRVLDVACGTGYGSDLLSQTAHSVVGGDISPETVSYSQKHYQRDNLKFEIMDIRHIPYPDNYFDVAVSIDTIGKIVEGEQFLGEIVRLLTGDGVCIISAPLGGPSENPHHVAYFQSGTFASYLSGFFEDVKLKFQRDDEFYVAPKSPYYEPTFTGEYALAFCRKPRLRRQELTSVIILTHNQLQHTKLCLQSIEQYTTQPYELILVDNGSTDGTIDYLHRYQLGRPSVRVIANKENLGFAAGNNQGLALADGNYVLMLNNDTVVTEGWLARMSSVFNRYPEVGIVGPVSNNISGPQKAQGASYQSLEKMHPFAKKWSAEHIGQTMEFQRVVGFCLLAKREVIDRIGGLDEQFGSGNFEDDDFCLRATAAGYKARIALDAFIHHTGSQTFKGAGINYQQSLLRNWEIFKAKWKLPQDLPYGASYTFNLDTRDLSQYYISLPDRTGINPLIIHTASHDKADVTVGTIGVFEKMGQVEQNSGNCLKQQGNPEVQQPIGFAEWHEAQSKEHTDLSQAETVKQTPSLNHPEFVKGLTSIIIPVQSIHLNECIAAIKEYTDKPHEIIFLDHGAAPKVKKQLAKAMKENSNYIVIKIDRRDNFTQSLNGGINQSTGEYIVLLFDDVIVCEGWLSDMLEFMNRGKKIGVVGAMAEDASPLQRVEGIDFKSLEERAAFRERNRHRRILTRNLDGFCMLFRRDLLIQIGLFDEMLGQDKHLFDDFCVRAVLEGYDNITAGNVFVHNLGGINRLLSRDKTLFDEKWIGLDASTPLAEKVLIANAMALARSQYHKGVIDEAVITIIKRIGFSPNEKRLYYQLADILLAENKFQDALGTLKGMPAAKDDAEYYSLLGYANEGMGFYIEAEEYVDKALAIDGQSAPALNLKGILAYRKADAGKAEEFFRRAMEADPGYGDPYTNMGMLRWKTEQKEEALDLVEKAFILFPDKGDLVNALYNAIISLDLYGRAEHIFREAWLAYPENKRILFLLIDILLKQDKFQEAMKEVEKAMVNFGMDEGILAAALEIRRKIGPKSIAVKDCKAKVVPTLSVCMIVKNEERHLAYCLNSLSPVADEMIVVDTGSTDKTKEIAEAFGAQVYDFEWTNDFAVARNHSLSKAQGDWILVMDADEVISFQDHVKLKKLLNKKDRVAYTLITRNYINKTAGDGWTCNDNTYIHEQAGRGWFPSGKVRLFPNNEKIRFEQPIHELVEYSLARIGIDRQESGIPVHHYGELDAKKATVKDAQYYELGVQKMKESGGDFKSVWELAVQAGELGKIEESIELWHKVLGFKQRDAAAYFNLANHYIILGKYEDSYECSRKSYALDPKDQSAVLSYAMSEFLSGDINRAISVLEGFLRGSNSQTSHVGLLAVSYLINGEIVKGLKYLRGLVKKKYNCVYYLKDLAKSLIAAGNLARAKALLTTAIEIKFCDQETSALLAKCDVGSGSSVGS